MKRVWFALWVLPLVIALAVWLAVDRTLDRWEANEWPGGLGRLSDVPKHLVEHVTNSKAQRLIELAAPLGINLTPGGAVTTVEVSPVPFFRVRDPLEKYLHEQLARPGVAVDAPPAVLAEYLQRHALDIDVVRDHLVGDGQVIWPSSLYVNAESANVSAISDLEQVLAARALSRARAGNASAWEDAHAAWLLCRTLWQSPLTAVRAFEVVRLVNAVAMKLPQPEPVWIADMDAMDYRTLFAGGIQAEVWAYRRSVPDLVKLRPVWQRPFVSPALSISFDEAAEKTRARIAELHRSTACDTAAVPSQIELTRWNLFYKDLQMNWLTKVWAPLARFSVELEAREKFAALRRGEKPSPISHCSDGQWIVDDHSVRFSRTIPPDSGPFSGPNAPLTLTLTR